MTLVGQINAWTKYGDQDEKLVLIVIGGNGPNLFGQNWLKYHKLEWKSILFVQTTKSE